ncbi:MAG: RDD family protein [Nereida ignava]|uniref:RDD family protein n=1 Tax=Nereida ignava TaxID=282199 RepID=UPI0030F9664C
MHSALPDPVDQAEFYADVPLKRLLAWGIDTLIIAAISIALCLLTLGVGFFIFFAVFFSVSFIYRVVTLARRSATVGMGVVAIEFRTAKGTKFDAGTAFLHTLGYVISFGVPVLQLISIILMLISEKRQGATDHLLGTVAINHAAHSR